MAGCRSSQLDALRGVAILLVLGHHPAAKADHAGAFLPLALAWHRVGWTGVDLFFVLSGYLVGGLLLEEFRASGRIDIRRFLVRRAFKIWPSYYVFLLLLAVLTARVGLASDTFWPLVVHVQNYVGRADLLAPHAWSLAVEEHFYLALPLALAAVPALRTARGATWAFAAITVTCAIARWRTGAERPWVMTHLRADSLAFGVLLAALHAEHPAPFAWLARHTLAAIAGAACVVWGAGGCAGPDPASSALVPVALYLAYGIVVCACVGTPERSRSPIATRALAGIGFYSYSIYIWHFNLAFGPISSLFGSPRLPLTWLAATVAYVALAVGVGVLTSRCIEAPFLALRDRMIPRRGGRGPGRAITNLTNRVPTPDQPIR